MTSESDINLRKATIDDLEILKYWDTQPHVIACHSDTAETIDDLDWKHDLTQDISWQELFMAELQGKPLGFVQIIDPFLEETHYWGDVGPNARAIDIWIGNIENTGKGYGTIMMNLALRHCFAQPNVSHVLIDPLASNLKARKFYEKIGFTFVEYHTFGEDYCAVYRFDRASLK